jgi:hypothetical protein
MSQPTHINGDPAIYDDYNAKIAAGYVKVTFTAQCSGVDSPDGIISGSAQVSDGRGGLTGGYGSKPAVSRWELDKLYQVGESGLFRADIAAALVATGVATVN